MRRIIALSVLAIGLACFVRAHATATVQVLATDPPGDTVTLARNQNFYLHLRYTSDRPVRIWARPYFEGKPANAGSNPSDMHPAGSGETLGWFFLMNPDARVDEVRIAAGDGSVDGTPVVATYPVRISGSAQEPSSAAQPEWVTRLRTQEQAAQRADYEQRMNTPDSAGDMALVSGFMLLMLAIGAIGFAGPAWGLWKWRGIWRWAAAVPAAIMAFVVLRIVIGVSIDPTSHNLWPFEILMWGFVSSAGIAVLMLVRRIFGVTAADPSR